MLRRIAISKKQHKDNNNTNNISFTLGYFSAGFLYWNSFVFNLENKFKRMPFWNHTKLLYWHLHLILIYNHLLPKGAIMCYEQMALALTLTLCIIFPSSATRARPYQFIFSLSSKGFWWSGKFNWISYLGEHNFKMWFVKYCLHCVNYRAFKEFEFQISKHHNNKESRNWLISP